MNYIVTDLSPVRHNGKVYQDGDIIAGLTEDQAAQLLSGGNIVEQPKKPAGRSAVPDA